MLFALVMIASNANAQVGIGTYRPDSSVVLDIKSTNKGILIPRMRAETAIKKEGSLIYDTIAHKYKFCLNDEWISVNPLNADANDNVSAMKSLTVSDSLTVKGSIVNADSATLRAKTFVGNGTVPIGGIIMWSGNIADIPDNWKLCDGTNGRPDLRGRFIEGYDPRKTDSAIRDSGGSDQITLTTVNLPTHNHEKGTLATLTAGEHQHDYNGYRAVDDGGGENVKSRGVIATDPKDYGGEPAGDHTHVISGSTANAGGAYTFDSYINPPKLYPPEDCFAFECDNGIETVYSSSDLSIYDNNPDGYYEAEMSGDNTSGYFQFSLTFYDIRNDRVTPSGYFISNYDVRWFTVEDFTCTYNDPIYRVYINPDYVSTTPVGELVYTNFKWEIIPFDNRPTYYVLAFIIRVE